MVTKQQKTALILLSGGKTLTAGSYSRTAHMPKQAARKVLDTLFRKGWVSKMFQYDEPVYGGALRPARLAIVLGERKAEG